MADKKCSFCGAVDDKREYLISDDGSATVCSTCAGMFTSYMQNLPPEEDASKSDIPDKNQLFGDALASIEDLWMEKNVINSYVLDCGGVINEIHFRFLDEGDDGYYLICELEVENIDVLPNKAEENILNEIEWAFDQIRDDLESRGLDLDAYLGEKVLITKVN